MITVILRTFKPEFLHLILLFFLDCSFRLLFSWLIVYLLEAVKENNIK